MAAQLVLFATIGAFGILDLRRHAWMSPWGSTAVALGLVAIIVGASVAGRGVLDLRPSLSPFPAPLAGAPLIDTGAYRLIRHAIQGEVYRRAHRIVIGGLVIAVGLLAFNPAIGTGLVGQAESRNVQAIDVLLPAFLFLFMLPSVAYAWMYPHREGDDPGGTHAWRLTGWLARAAAR